MPSARRLLPFALLAIALASLSACARVAPYERGALAHPTMTMSDMGGVGEEHVRAVHEGAMGGGLSAGGGCGCN